MRARRRRGIWLGGCAIAIAASLSPLHARADEAPDAPEALAAFVEGTSLVKQARWAQALAAFERAARIRPHAITTYNIGACERALGHYTRARKVFRAALAENDAAGGKQLPDSLVERTRGYLAEIDGLIVRVSVTIVPEGAAIAVDGGPLELDTTAAPTAKPVLIGGTRAPGAAEVAPAGSFDLLLDPGAHVLSLTRKGFATAVINRTLTPGATVPLRLELDRLPATLRVTSAPSGAIATVNGADVGPTPIDVLRPAGTHRIVVKKAGRVPYEASISTQPGEQVKILATLPEDRPALTERWWFWTAAGVVVAGAAAATYLATRTDPEPTRTEVSGGSFGWRVRVP
jgi:hypothetical protein